MSFVARLIDTETERQIDVTINAPTPGAALGVIWRSYQFPRYVWMNRGEL